ncbi:MAG: NYN domain-containing protein [Chromatiaceae bacterium]|nr:NYN domain-containing protein [Chromatiaceae bacterium]
MTGSQLIHRTIIYIDGFNFYYGALRNTKSKWLNLESLFRRVLGPKNDIVKVKYFTAKVQPTPSDPNVHVRQNAYLNAIQNHCPLVEVYFGHFLQHSVRMENAHPPPNTVEVWKKEEKGSDVNLALHILNDAWLDAYDCAVIVSNDSDLAESLRLVKFQHKKLIGLITPGSPTRKTSKQLKRYADFMRTIRGSALQKSQLPDPIPGTTIKKPPAW